MDTISGFRAISIIPGKTLVQRATDFAAGFAPGSQFQTEHPHIPLYWGWVRDLPRAEVFKVICASKGLIGHSLQMGHVEAFADHNLVWNVSSIDAQRWILDMFRLAVRNTFRPYLVPDAQGPNFEDLYGDGPSHMGLAWFPEPIDDFTPDDRTMNGTIADIALIPIGEVGTWNGDAIIRASHL